MIAGTYRDNHPRVALTLDGVYGKTGIEFILDTGFEGDLKLPPHVAATLDLTYIAHEYH